VSSCFLKESMMVFSRSGLVCSFSNVLNKNEKNILLACSGGPDSAALIGTARVMINRGIINSAHVVHINHNLREEAVDDLKICHAQSEHFGIPFFSYDVFPALKSGNTYDVARKLRYQMLQHHSVTHGMDVIATAHHADDVAETILMHLSRGCGIDGLCGVRQRHSSLGDCDVVRPFLSVRKNRLEEICNKAKLEFCIDKSNFNTEKSRAYLRHSVIPALEKLNPAFVMHVAKTAMIVQGMVEKNSDKKNNKEHSAHA
jgi:tRNA(Ile)-lysidine synthase